ncbi:MAG: hypothetical protein RBS80_28810 [Thermoguttaceae bacterium]|jgi:hypothetical protein|nr:hypothetical protein [Thermoguttaceae bacterium]
MRYTRHNTRRGVLLLVILALLAMFGMVAVTFVVVASQARIAAEAHQRLDEVTDPPDKLLNSALLQVLRGSNNPASAIGPHSLLEDVYGNDWVGSAISSASQYAGGAMIELGVPLPIATVQPRIGGVLTVIPPADASMVGRSARIVDAVDDGGGGSLLRLLPFDGVSVIDAVSNLGSAAVVISGAPFSGIGFTDYALEPGNPENRAPGVMANEDYDAPDYQNMILGAQLVDEYGNLLTDASGNVIGIIPSLHRPELVGFHGGIDPAWVLRPQHSTFTGSNPAFDAINGPWDVDNDGDGVPDSIWVDLGFPARSSPDGRLVKPLFAILCVDLDGRLNLNAHGSLAQVDPDYYSAPTPSTGHQFADGAITVRGQGYGPPEVNLSTLFADPTLITVGSFSDTYEELLLGTPTWPGRYGHNDSPGIEDADLLATRRWLDTSNRFAYPSFQPSSGYNYTDGYWKVETNYVPDHDPRSAYGTPPDMHGTIAVGLDRAGRPIWDPDFCGQSGDDNPYEMNTLRRVSRGTADGVDAAFSTTELERLLRVFDRDASTLPPRLLELGGAALAAHRHEVTTDSVDMPVVGHVVDPSTGVRYGTFMELVSTKYPHLTQEQLADLFDPDLLAGRKMNLNRPLPARGNVTADPPPEYLEARQLLARHLFCLAMFVSEPHAGKNPLAVRRIAQWAVNVVDFLDDDPIMTPFEYVEDPFATGWTAPVGRPTTTTDKLLWGMERPELLLTETLAFHDRRVADLGWEAGIKDGIPYEENFRRTDPIEPEPATGPAPADLTLDQPRIPQGSLFLELYCTTEPGTKPSEALFYRNPDDGQWFLDLNKRPRNRPRNSPVWRLVITRSARTPAAPNNISSRFSTEPLFIPETEAAVTTVEAERTVWFTAPTLTSPEDDPEYFNFSGVESVRLAPRDYLVVGPREETVVGSTKKTDGTPPGSSAQKIILTPGGSPPISVTANASGGRAYPEIGQIRTPKVMLAQTGNDRIGISVSEPIPAKYYPSPTHAGPDGVNDWYGDPETGPFLDEPLDSKEGTPLNPTGGPKMLATDTYQGYKYVLLQRLADPTHPHSSDNPHENPYRTVDWMPIDLTVFNGQDRPSALPAWLPYADWDPDDSNPDVTVDFATRQRDGEDNPFWSSRAFNAPFHPRAYSLQLGDEPYFKAPLRHSLGFLNEVEGFGSPTNPPGRTEGGHIGDPLSPFPWLTWNNRPFVNPHELLMVPATTAGRFGWEFTTGDTSPVAFAHLMDFFDSSSGVSQLHRIFDFLEVPSRFVGAQLYVPGVDPPNHLAPTYREPGKVNLNTLYSERVFRALMNGFREGEADFWRDFVRSRRGYGDSDDPMELSTSFPTRFARPFRSAAAHALRAEPDPADREIDSTLLRSEPGEPSKPLFAFLPSPDDSHEVNDPGRNPYFRYQGLMRLDNLVTTRSNVYAVWITVGFFEVTVLDTYDPAFYPDGLQLGYELGADTGEIRRHRAFYIIDRSVPVGFVRGQDGNAEKTVLLQRFIE